MQIIQNIRDKGAAIVIAVIALSLIGFIMMDAKQQGGSGLFSSNSTSIGKVNGETVDNKEFDDRIKQTEAQYGGRITGTQVYQLRQFVWDKIVDEKIKTAEFEKLGLAFTPKEMMSVMFGNDAPQMLKQAFTDKNTGVYDVEKVKEWWTKAKKFKDTARAMVDEQVIEPMKMEVLNNKYSSLLAAASYYPTWLQQKESNDNKAFAAISYVAVPYNVISDSTVKVSDDDITAYMGKHPKLYKQDGGRLLSYVTFSNSPSAADTTKTFETVAGLKAGLVADSNASNYVGRNMSTIKYQDAYTPKAKLPASESDTIASLAPGAVFGPYLDGANFVLAKMVATRQLPDSVKARHVLIGTVDPQTGQPMTPDSIAHKRIDSIEAAIKGGADFTAMVLQYSDDQGSKLKGGEYDWPLEQFSSLAKEYAEAIFYGNAGDKKVVKTDFGWHYIEVISQKNFQPAYKVAYMAREILASDETINLSSSKAAKLAGEARTSKELDAYIVKNGLKKVDVPNVVKENDSQLGGLQDARQLIKWAFGAKAGDVSEPFNVDDQYVVAVVNKVQPEGLPDAKTARPMVEQTVRNVKKAEEIKKKLGATLESAAAAYGKQVLTAGADSTLTFNSQIINDIGQEPKLIGAAFNKAYQTKVSEPIEGANGVYVIKVTSVGNKPADTPEAIAQQTAEKVKLLSQQASYGWYESLKKQAAITDSRSKFY